MLNKTHLVSAHLAYSLSERLNLGIRENSVQHERQGQERQAPLRRADRRTRDLFPPVPRQEDGPRQYDQPEHHPPFRDPPKSQVTERPGVVGKRQQAQSYPKRTYAALAPRVEYQG